MGDTDMAALLNDLPVVKCISIPVTGKISEISLDLAPEVRPQTRRPTLDFSPKRSSASMDAPMPTSNNLTYRCPSQENAIAKTLGGDATFVGMYGAANLVIMSLRNPTKKDKVNAYSLPKPFQDEKVQGPMLLVRMVDGSPEVSSCSVDSRVYFFNSDPSYRLSNRT